MPSPLSIVIVNTHSFDGLQSQTHTSLLTPKFDTVTWPFLIINM